MNDKQKRIIELENLRKENKLTIAQLEYDITVLNQELNNEFKKTIKINNELIELLS